MVPGTTTKVIHTGNGDGPYPIPSGMTVNLDADGNATDLVVTLTDPAGTETELTLTTDYTVTGRNVYTVEEYDSTYTITISRDLSYTQERNLRNQSTLNMEHLEAAFDQACMERQDLLSRQGRQIHVPISDDSPDTELPGASGRASTFLAFNADGDVTVSSGTGTPCSPAWADVIEELTIAAGLVDAGFTATLEELNRVADGITATATELNQAADLSVRTKVLSGENYTILDDDEVANILVTTGAGSTGTATTNTENKLIDSGATFQTDGVAAGDYIHNTTDDTWGIVDTVDSETQLTLTTDAFPDGNEDWEWVPVTIALPTAADNAGREIFIKKLDSATGHVHLVFEAGEDETGVSQLEGDGGYIELISDGSDWYIKDYWDSKEETAGWWEKRADGTMEQWGILTENLAINGGSGFGGYFGTGSAQNFPKEFAEIDSLQLTPNTSHYIMSCYRTLSVSAFTVDYRTIDAQASAQDRTTLWRATGRWK